MIRRERRPAGALVVAAIIHIVVIAVLTSVLRVPVLELLLDRPDVTTDERVTFIATEPPPTAEPVTPPPLVDETRRDTGGRAAAEPPPLIPPVVVPQGVARGDADRGRTDTTVGRGTGDPLAGLRPPTVDPRLLGRVGAPPSPGAVRAPQFVPDSVVASWATAYWDSVARAQARNPAPNTDWTIKRGEDKYGIDPYYIYFGKFKLPTALLAMLPINVQSNPTVYERNRALTAMREDIMYHAMRANNEDDFKASVERIRARVERERAAKKNEKGNQSGR